MIYFISASRYHITKKSTGSDPRGPHVDQGVHAVPVHQPLPGPPVRPVRPGQRGVLEGVRAAEPGLYDELEQPGVHDRDHALPAAVDVWAQQRDDGGVFSGPTQFTSAFIVYYSVKLECVGIQ